MRVGALRERRIGGRFTSRRMKRTAIGSDLSGDSGFIAPQRWIDCTALGIRRCTALVRARRAGLGPTAVLQRPCSDCRDEPPMPFSSVKGPIATASSNAGRAGKRCVDPGPAAWPTVGTAVLEWSRRYRGRRHCRWVADRDRGDASSVTLTMSALFSMGHPNRYCTSSRGKRGSVRSDAAFSSRRSRRALREGARMHTESCDHWTARPCGPRSADIERSAYGSAWRRTSITATAIWLGKRRWGTGSHPQGRCAQRRRHGGRGHDRITAPRSGSRLKRRQISPDGLGGWPARRRGQRGSGSPAR
ncbi:hypothetical protein SAMN05216551_109102 [Chitinasiproducens palmae]|uniref:Uncharacterized protein n=1 Tax=Chitinasiproducens palmae TaxID=1770053 RepID=A0A1H2PSZ5_9BURK|nr:hypothetical protein SAMN05216551_109102 [Chitinasiproducens palmae]